MAYVDVFGKRVTQYNEDAELHLREELFGEEQNRNEKEIEMCSVEEIAEILEIAEEDANFLLSCGAFKTYRMGDVNRVKKKSIEERKMVIKAAFTYRDKQTVTVREIGRILGLGKTAVYRLVNQCVFKSYVICGGIRVDTASFDKWYASQFHYRKVDGERPGKKYGNTFGPTTIGKVLGIANSTGLDLLNNGEIDFIVVDGKRRVLEESFWKWYESQNKYVMKKTIEEVEGYVY